MDEIPVLVFDEVDANVGGETAECRRRKDAANRRGNGRSCASRISRPSRRMASAHYVVTKQLKEGRTISEIALLDKKERVTELARMLGGQSDAARKHAAELLL